MTSCETLPEIFLANRASFIAACNSPIVHFREKKVIKQMLLIIKYLLESVSHQLYPEAEL